MDDFPYSISEVQKSAHLNLKEMIFVNICIVATLFVIIVNLLVIIAILTDVKLRGKLFFKLILTISLAYFLQGILVLPLYIEFYANHAQWKRAPELCAAWYLTDLMLMVILTLLFLVLMLERFFSWTCARAVASCTCGCFMIICPWMFGVAFVLVLYFTSSNLILYIFPSLPVLDVCQLHLFTVQVHAILGFFMPAAFIFGFCWANLVVMCIVSKNRNSVTNEDPNINTTVGCLVSLCFVVMWMPSNCISLWNLAASIDVTAILFVAFANGVLTPCLWLIIPAIRHRFHRMCCCCCPHSCCPPPPPVRVVLPSATDESRIRIYDPEPTQPSATTKL